VKKRNRFFIILPPIQPVGALRSIQPHMPRRRNPPVTVKVLQDIAVSGKK